MSTFWDQFKQKVKTGLAVSSEKIEEYSHIGKLKLEILGTKRNISHLFRDLGKIAFNHLEKGTADQFPENEEVKTVLNRIKTAQQMLSDLEEQLAQAPQKDARQDSAEPAPVNDPEE